MKPIIDAFLALVCAYSSTLLRHRYALSLTMLADQYFNHISNGAVIAISRNAQHFLQHWVNTKVKGRSFSGWHKKPPLRVTLM
ncbi:MAG: hypothetical protein ACJAS1_004621 [Oleiphilaceae bacterium]|jgi:hypothetical protein